MLIHFVFAVTLLQLLNAQNVPAVAQPEFTPIQSDSSALQVRDRRQYSYTFYYLCGNPPNQYLSYTPCNNCNNCNNNCQYTCSTTQYCRQFNSAWSCVNRCCTAMYNPTQAPTTTNRPAPLCGGREASGGYCRAGSRCDAGFLCTSSNVCCRCAYGTSIGPCVNGKCPDNTQCNQNNECCPYQVSG
ncbi:unnamed protein product [Auanema sp. JU1783]|nr:unnamed protein product [Auanema sp. JU1783]